MSAHRVYVPEVIYCITVEDKDIRHYVSSENCRVGQGLVESYDFVRGERQNYEAWKDCLGIDFDDGDWENAVVVESFDTEYCVTDCPRDGLITELPLRRIGKGERGNTYIDVNYANPNTYKIGLPNRWNCESMIDFVNIKKPCSVISD